MHKTLLKEASEEQLKSFLMKSFDEIKLKDYEMYEELELDLYKEMYGCHFNKWMLEKALNSLENENGSKGSHWSLETTTQVATNNNIALDKNYNEYDWCYVMNMMYSDYYSILGNDTNNYVKMSRAFLDDKDAPVGKAFKYYIAMKH